MPSASNGYFICQQGITFAPYNRYQLKQKRLELEGKEWDEKYVGLMRYYAFQQACPGIGTRSEVEIHNRQLILSSLVFAYGKEGCFLG